MTQYAETQVLKLGGTCPAMPQPFGTIFGKFQGFLATVGVHSGFDKKRLSQPTQLLRPGILGHFPNTYKPVYHGSLV